MDLPRGLEKRPHIRWIIEHIDSDLETHFKTEIPVRLLLHGTTIHGGQKRDTRGELVPNTYYHTKTAVGIAMNKLSPESVGVIGLGTGVLASYGQDGQTIDFFEIDPLMIKIAEEYFGNVNESKADVRTIAGDGRIEISRMPDKSYDMIVLDAFSSDAVPTHLLTLEAMTEYIRTLKDDGVILCHISNHYVNLWPVLNGTSSELGMHIVYHSSSGKSGAYLFPASWVAMSKNKQILDTLSHGEPGWRAKSDKKIVWTDDYSSLWPILKFK